jgi:hypothetical protein
VGVVRIDGIEEGFGEEHLDGEVDSIFRGGHTEETGESSQTSPLESRI